MNRQNVFLFIIGFGIGAIFGNFRNENENDHRVPEFQNIMEIESNLTESDVTETNNSQNQRILCVLSTAAKNHQIKAIHAKTTWGRYCDKLIFTSGTADLNLGAFSFNISDSYDNLWGKTKEAMIYIYEKLIDDYDWIYKGDDDSFMIIENLRYLLTSYSTDAPLHFGHKYYSEDLEYGFFSGGSGYVLSKFALKLFVERALTDSSICKIKSNAGKEDLEIARCLNGVGALAVDSRDLLERKRFLPLPLDHHLSGEVENWYRELEYYPMNEGTNCCSKYAVSNHYVQPKQMYSRFFLIYHMKVFGIQMRYPRLPKMVSTEDVLMKLEKQLLV